MIKPADNEFMERFKSMESRIEALETQTTPQLIDWYDFQLSDFSMTTTDILVYDGDAERFFNPGDKLRVKVGGSYEYYYVYRVDNSNIYIDAGNVNTLTPSNLSSATELGLSKVSSPSGFPDFFTFDIDLSAGAINITGSVQFTMKGRAVIVTGNVAIFSFQTDDKIIATIPLESDTTIATYGVATVAGAGVDEPCRIEPSTSDDEIRIERLDNSNFPSSGSGFLTFSHIYKNKY